MPCFTEAEAAAQERIALQHRLGLDVEWLSSADIDSRNTGIARGDAGRFVRGGRRVHQRAPQRAGLHRGIDRLQRRRPGELRVHRTAGGPRPRHRVETARGPIATSHVVLTGGPQLGAVGAAAVGSRPAAPGIRWSSPNR